MRKLAMRVAGLVLLAHSTHNFADNQSILGFRLKPESDQALSEPIPATSLLVCFC